MNRELWLRALAAALLLLAVAGIASVTEWTEVEVPLPARGEAADNSLYAMQSLLRKLGGTVVRRQELDALPTAGAHLVLTSQHWQMFPARSQRLREWVEQGGHLVVPESLAGQQALEDWFPVNSIPVQRTKETNNPDGKSAPRSPGAKRDGDGCREVSELSTPATDGAAPGRRYRTCTPAPQQFFQAANGKALWSLQSPDGAEIMRAALGRGTVTVVAGWWMLTSNRTVLQADHAPIVVAALQLQPGREIWFVTDEKREALLVWTWQQGWPAVLLALLALAAALWRAAVRFGPLSVAPALHRRSMREQVCGTAHFLQRQGPGALHAAQLRAFDECARRKLRLDTQLDASARTQSIARITGLDAPALAQAQKPGPRKPVQLTRDLELLETARRRLEAHHP